MKVIFTDSKGFKVEVEEVRSATFVEPGVQVQVSENDLREIIVTRKDPKGTVMRDGMVSQLAIDGKNGAVNQEMYELDSYQRGVRGIWRDTTGETVKVLKDNRPRTGSRWQQFWKIFIP